MENEEGDSLALSRPARPFLQTRALLIKEAIKKQKSPDDEDGGGFRKPMPVTTDVNEVRMAK